MGEQKLYKDELGDDPSDQRLISAARKYSIRRSYGVEKLLAHLENFPDIKEEAAKEVLLRTSVLTLIDSQMTQDKQGSRNESALSGANILSALADEFARKDDTGNYLRNPYMFWQELYPFISFNNYLLKSYQNLLTGNMAEVIALRALENNTFFQEAGFRVETSEPEDDVNKGYDLVVRNTKGMKDQKQKFLNGYRNLISDLGLSNQSSLPQLSEQPPLEELGLTTEDLELLKKLFDQDHPENK